MAITKVENDTERSGFIVNANSADLSGCEELKAAAAGKSIYIERLTVNSEAALNVTIGEGETAGAVTTIVVGPLYLAANGTVSTAFEKALKLTAATALTIDASGAGNVTVIVEGFVR